MDVLTDLGSRTHWNYLTLADRSFGGNPPTSYENQYWTIELNTITGYQP